MAEEKRMPLVAKSCVIEAHRCMTCYERMMTLKRKGLPKDVQIQIVRLLKVKECSLEELAQIFDYPVEIIRKTMENMEKDGLINDVKEDSTV